MLFNSIDFAVFLPIVFILYWFVFQRSIKAQNALLLAASYLFYGWWDWRFLSLIAFSSLVDYSIGVGLSATKNVSRRKLLLWTSLAVNLGLLGFFKYYNFFADNFVTAFTWFGASISANSLDIILPVGISFYTFQTLSYTIDVYREKLEPTKDFIAFTAFVSFFPQLVAGPIERASNLLPQFFKKRVFDYAKAVDGCKQILWGFIKKIVIADNCAEYSQYMFAHSEELNGSALFLGVFFFTIQIYGDFSGYSDIAIGTARLFGFDLMKNFAFPFFSRDISEFWRRWHISLSTWFRDYLYFPLGGSKGSQWFNIRNVIIIFVVSGFWHGAAWTYVFWGALNAFYIIPVILLGHNKTHIEIVAKGRLFPSFKDALLMMLNFGLVLIAFIVFRAENMGHAWDYFCGVADSSLFQLPNYPLFKPSMVTMILIFLFFMIEWLGREQEFAIASSLSGKPAAIRWSFYVTLIFVIGMFMQTQETSFIYFQF